MGEILIFLLLWNKKVTLSSAQIHPPLLTKIKFSLNIWIATSCTGVWYLYPKSHYTEIIPDVMAFEMVMFPTIHWLRVKLKWNFHILKMWWSFESLIWPTHYWWIWPTFLTVTSFKQPLLNGNQEIQHEIAQNKNPDFQAHESVDCIPMQK